MNGVQRTRTRATNILPQLHAVLPMTRRAQVAETLRSFILSGQLAPGTQLVESKLASQFGVSRSSIREAIWALIDQGLLFNRPYAGTFVVSVDEKTMTDVFSLRGAIERYCFTELWPVRDKVFRNGFTARHNALVKAIKANKHSKALEAEMQFHSYPYEFSRNQTLLDVWHQLSKKIQLGFAMTQGFVRDSEFIENSERYIEIALADDLDAMLEEIHRHLAFGVRDIRRLMAEGPPSLHPANEFEIPSDANL